MKRDALIAAIAAGDKRPVIRHADETGWSFVERRKQPRRSADASDLELVQLLVEVAKRLYEDQYRWPCHCDTCKTIHEGEERIGQAIALGEARLQ